MLELCYGSVLLDDLIVAQARKDDGLHDGAHQRGIHDFGTTFTSILSIPSLWNIRSARTLSAWVGTSHRPVRPFCLRARDWV